MSEGRNEEKKEGRKEGTEGEEGRKGGRHQLKSEVRNLGMNEGRWKEGRKDG